MSEQGHYDVAIIGAGIMGLAHAWMAARRGKRVVVFERLGEAQGASVRNFGMIWPIGQPAGERHEVALRSRELWQQLLEDARLPYRRTGSLHAVHAEDEAEVAQEFAALGPGQGFDVRWLGAAEAQGMSPALKSAGLRGALYSPVEMTVDPRLIVGSLPGYLREKWGVEFHFSTPVLSSEIPFIETPRGTFRATRAVICNGADFESLYPDLFEEEMAGGLTRCKLQMLRTVAQPGGWELGPALAFGLTLRFYAAFGLCPSLEKLKTRLSAEMPEYEDWQIHVMASQTARGELTLGDSHEYSRSPGVFHREDIDQLILDYLDARAVFPDRTIAERWDGIYAKHPAKGWIHRVAEPGVEVVNGVGGAGMTLSMGLAELILAEI